MMGDKTEGSNHPRAVAERAATEAAVLAMIAAENEVDEMAELVERVADHARGLISDRELWEFAGVAHLEAPR